MTRKPRIAVILGSTRDSRFGAKPAEWILEKAQARGDWEVELVDLKDHDLPLFNEVASNAWMPSADARATAWQEKIAAFDGYIFVVAEYNRSITGALKNALDQAYVDWNRKAFGVVGYGALGAARAVEHLRTIGIELQMVSTRSGVHIAGADFFAVHPLGQQNQPLSAIEATVGGSAKAMLDELDWWTRATMAARAEARTKAA
ncbi:MAG: NAD(P)H-dependent oxidoreductase [Rhodobacter sp.]|uniref:NADPH-dependent FMN reductase n=1 Tax=Pararhodobacter sp. TaxID=2127056 RepID=UPI001DCC55F9|nr:NAD(P)H-dependent oxidoreductase [Pararhodobacter sp.]MCB1345763.1 NAD(P)H-dependent oxidoreductase [Paracoccaceae bacterium]MCC0074185.1 NAD(P)H-dependent oxidoreductase [Rhodobacter sp.]HPD93335.1 NAD(P)H-dependent oxidoreductase [Pararhodobacter sp.]